jgi:dihydrofolate reductase
VLNTIVAFDKLQGLGYRDKKPWSSNKADKLIADLIGSNPIVMGWNTFINKSIEGLETNHTTVLTKKVADPDCKEQLQSFLSKNKKLFFSNLKDKDIKDLQTSKGTTWCLGGGKTFEYLLPYSQKVFILEFQQYYVCDTHLPRVPWDNPKKFILKNEEFHVDTSCTPICFKMLEYNVVK